MNSNHTTRNSINSKRKVVALSIILTICTFLAVSLSGNRPNENPKTAKETPTAESESKKETTPVGEFDAAEHFRQMHNRALSPQVREKCPQRTLEEKLSLEAYLR